MNIRAHLVFSILGVITSIVTVRNSDVISVLKKNFFTKIKLNVIIIIIIIIIINGSKCMQY